MTTNQPCRTPSEVDLERVPGETKETYVPSVDIYETENELCILADMPGIDPKEMELMFDSGELTIRGRVARSLPQGQKWLVREYGIGDYRRTFTVGETIDSSRISAEYELGVLKVHCPKIEAVKPRRIPINKS